MTTKELAHLLTSGSKNHEVVLASDLSETEDLPRSKRNFGSADLESLLETLDPDTLTLIANPQPAIKINYDVPLENKRNEIPIKKMNKQTQNGTTLENKRKEIPSKKKTKTNQHGTTKNIKQIFIGRCYEYQFQKNFTEDRELDCNLLWEKFSSAFKNKKPCAVTSDDYTDFLDAIDEDIPSGKVKMLKTLLK